MDLGVVGDVWTVNGTIKNHVTPTDPTSALASGSPIWSVNVSGLLSDPNPALGIDRVLTNPGEIGLMARGHESISLPDNVGVSITNFTIPTPVPEPSSVLLLGTAAVFAGYALRRRTAKRLRS